MRILLGNVAAFGQKLNQTRREQGMAFGFRLNQVRKLRRKIIRCETRVQITGNMLLAQRVESDFFAQLVRLHLGFVVLERMITAFEVFGAKGADY